VTAGKKRPAKKSPVLPGTGPSLRETAENQLARSKTRSPDPAGKTAEEIVHELQVHRIELELQAEELRRTHLELEEARDRYVDLYEFAPIGYLTLTDKGLVSGINLTGATLLGVERGSLINTRFSRIVADDDCDTWHRYFMNVLGGKEKLACTLMLMRGNGSVFPARLEGVRITGSDRVTPTVRVTVDDISDIREAENTLRLSEEKYRGLFAAESDGIVVIDRGTGIMSDCNDAFPRMYGYRRDEVIGRPYTMVVAAPGAPLVTITEILRFVPVWYHRKKDGTVFPVEITASVLALQGRDSIIAAVRDITERRQADIFRQLSFDVGGILNGPAEQPEVIRHLLAAIRRATNADAVGIRIKSGDDFPYLAQSGFSCEFLEKENSLAARDREAGICRGPDGTPSLECTCGLVISGKTDPENPLFSPGGSAWTNNSRLLLELQETDDPRFRPRNTCIHAGYASVAIIPIRKNPHEIIGTLQINALRKDCFTPGIIRSLELIAGQIGEALMRRNAEEALRRALAEKGVLLSEVHHRVKNNLQIISGLLDMTRTRTPDPATSAILTDMMLKIQTMALIHTRLYESKEFDRINIGEQIRDQVSDLANVYRTGPGISCSVDAEDIFLPVDRAIPLALVVNEVLSNAFKHAFKGRESGSIAVSVRREKGDIQVSIEDDGSGIPGGVDIHKSTSLGLKLIRNLVQQLQGALSIESSSHGFRVSFSFPLTIKER
jgi:PAS domain S-box-containing protein